MIEYKMRNNTQYLELFNKNIVFDNKIYKVIKISSIYIYMVYSIHKINMR